MRKLAVIMIIIFFLTGGRVNGKEITQGIKERNQTAREFYTVWKSKYVVKKPYAKGAEQYYIWYSKEKFDFVAAGTGGPLMERSKERLPDSRISKPVWQPLASLESY